MRFAPIRIKLIQFYQTVAKGPVRHETGAVNPWRVFVRTSLIVFLISVVLVSVSLKRIERLPLSGADLHFEAARAHQTMTTLAKKFPYRLPWHQNRIAAGDYLFTELKKLGLHPKEMMFSEVIGGVRYSHLRNIYAELKGTERPDEIITVVAHYDTTDTTIEGAMDDASGVGVVMELARVFSKEQPRRTVLFLLTDSEEFGAFWGARTFAQSFERADKIIAALSFDFVAPEKQKAILVLTDGLKDGFTPLWLRELALDSIRSVDGVEARDLPNVLEFIQRALLIPAADHGAFLQAGIPAMNWVGQMENFSFEMSHYHHTPHDVAESMHVESFETYGKAAERWLRSLDGLGQIPENFRDHDYFKVSENLYLEGWLMTVLQILAFLPFVLYGLTKFSLSLARYPRPTIIRGVKNEAKAFVILVGSFLGGYLLMRLLPALKIITQYETFPATQKAQLLDNPNFLAIVLVLAASVGIYFVFRKVFQEKDDSADLREIRHAVQALFLAAAIVVAFLRNSYLACLLLLPPAYFWTAIRGDRGLSTPSRVFNFLLLMGGALTFMIMAAVMSSVFYVGVIYWYLFLAAAYGLVSAYTAVVFFIVLAIMFRIGRSLVFRA